MRTMKFFAFPMFALVLVVFAVSSANGIGAYTQLPTILTPGTPGFPNPVNGNFDISWYDSARDRFYFADARRGAGLGALEVIDVQTGTVISTITGFTGFAGAGGTPGGAKNGPDGVLVINGNEAWVGDGNTTVKVVDVDAKAIKDTIDISAPPFALGTTRADEEAYDAYNHIILMTVPDGDLPYAALIDQSGPLSGPHKVLNYIAFPDGTNGGIEQPIWDPVTRKFYINVPNSNSNPLGGDLYQIDGPTGKITAVYHGPCPGRGLTLLPGSRAMSSCRAVFDLKTGAILAGPGTQADGTTRGFAGAPRADEVWYNPGDDRVYFGSNIGSVVDASTYDLIRMSNTAIRLGLSAGVIDQATYQVVTNLFGFPLPAGPTGAQVGVFGGHTVAASSTNLHVFFPIVNVGVKVFAEN
jgi:hypothetical protein